MFKKTHLILIIIILFGLGLILGQTATAQTTCYCSCAGPNGDVYIGPKNTEQLCSDACGLASYKCSATAPAPNTTNNNTSNNTSNNSISVTDPLGINNGGPAKLYARIIGALLSFVGIASLVAFIYAGFVFLISAGSPERVKKAKDTMLYAVIGIFVAMASYAILSFIFTTLEGATGQGGG